MPMTTIEADKRDGKAAAPKPSKGGKSSRKKNAQTKKTVKPKT